MKEGVGEGKEGKVFPTPSPLAPFFARSLSLVPRSFLRNNTETLATQAITDSASVQPNAIFAEIDPYIYIVPTVTKRISQPRFKAVWHAGRRYSISCLGR